MGQGAVHRSGNRGGTAVARRETRCGVVPAAHWRAVDGFEPCSEG
jgi:hypothetical protein